MRTRNKFCYLTKNSFPVTNKCTTGFSIHLQMNFHIFTRCAKIDYSWLFLATRTNDTFSSASDSWKSKPWTAVVVSPGASQGTVHSTTLEWKCVRRSSWAIGVNSRLSHLHIVSVCFGINTYLIRVRSIVLKRHVRVCCIPCGETGLRTFNIVEYAKDELNSVQTETLDVTTVCGSLREQKSIKICVLSIRIYIKTNCLYISRGR